MDKKILIAYFSCTGTTEKAAKALAELTGADLYEIVPAQPYSRADLDWNDPNSRSSVEMRDTSCRPAIAGKAADMDQYGTVVVGFPVWWYVAPAIIHTFLESYDFNGKTLIPFATSGGSGIANCEKNLRKTHPEIRWKNGKLLNGGITRGTTAGWI